MLLWYHLQKEVVKVESSSSEDEFEPTGLRSRSPTPSTSGIAVQTPVSSSPPPLMHVACGQSTPQSSDSPLQGSAYRCCFRHCEGEVHIGGYHHSQQSLVIIGDKQWHSSESAVDFVT